MSHHTTPEPFLAQIDRLIVWESLASLINAISARMHTHVALPAVKLALLAHWYGMNEDSLMRALQDRISFRRFLMLPLDYFRDDVRLAEAFRVIVAQAPLEMQNLIQFIEAQLLSKGYTLKAGIQAETGTVPTLQDAMPANSAVCSTTLFQPGEMAKLGMLGESVVARSERIAENPPPETGSDVLLPPAQPALAPLQCIIEWPWGATSELKERLSIGRDSASCPFARELQPYRHVSRKHAELAACGDGIWVRDLRSRNGTFVNDQEVPAGQALLIESDSRLRCGPNLVILLDLKR